MTNHKAGAIASAYSMPESLLPNIALDLNSLGFTEVTYKRRGDDVHGLGRYIFSGIHVSEAVNHRLHGLNGRETVFEYYVRDGLLLRIPAYGKKRSGHMTGTEYNLAELSRLIDLAKDNPEQNRSKNPYRIPENPWWLNRTWDFVYVVAQLKDFEERKAYQEYKNHQIWVDDVHETIQQLRIQQENIAKSIREAQNSLSSKMAARDEFYNAYRDKYGNPPEE